MQSHHDRERAYSEAVAEAEATKTRELAEIAEARKRALAAHAKATAEAEAARAAAAAEAGAAWRVDADAALDGPIRAFMAEPSRRATTDLVELWGKLDARARRDLGQPASLRRVSYAIGRVHVERFPGAVGKYAEDRFWFATWSDSIPELEGKLGAAIESGDPAAVHAALVALESKICEPRHHGAPDPRALEKWAAMIDPNPSEALAKIAEREAAEQRETTKRAQAAWAAQERKRSRNFIDRIMGPPEDAA